MDDELTNDTSQEPAEGGTDTSQEVVHVDSLYESRAVVGRAPPKSETILSQVKELLFIPLDHNEYDGQMLSYINTLLVTAYQIGIVHDRTLRVTPNTLWNEIFSEEIGDSAKGWLSMNVRQLFDPPQGAASGVIAAAIEEQTYRLREQVESEVFNSG